jgi:hypothetical protein
MFNAKDVQHGVKKFTPVSLFTLAMILLGALVNTFPPDEESIVIGRDFNCDDIPRRNLSARVTPFNNFSDHTVVPSLGLAAVSLLLPLMPLVVPVFALDVKKHTGWSHSIVENPDNPLGVTASARAELNKIAARFVLQLVVGQASCYGSTELARHFILKPDKTFFEKCKFSRTTCKTLERVGMLVYRVGGNDTTSNVTSLCQNSDLPHLALHESLHSLPNTTCSVIGSSLVMFVVAMWTRRRILNYAKRTGDEGQEEEKRKRPAEGEEMQPVNKTVQRIREEAAKDRKREAKERRAKINSKIEVSLQELHPYFKIGLLLLSLGFLTVLLVDSFRQRRNTVYEILGSLLCGIVVQCFVNVFYALKKDSFF